MLQVVKLKSAEARLLECCDTFPAHASETLEKVGWRGTTAVKVIVSLK